MVKQLHMARREENSRVGRMTQQICWICVCGTSTSYVWWPGYKLLSKDDVLVQQLP